MNQLYQVLKRTLTLLKNGFITIRPNSPTIITFNVTTACNMSCLHCMSDCWGDPRHDLSLEEIKILSENLGQKDSIGLGGGEPFLRDDLKEICEILSQKNGVRNFYIPTNGYDTELIIPKIEEILNVCQDQFFCLALSIDGFSSTHDKIRRKGSYDRTMETAKKLIKLKGKFSNLKVTFNTAVHNQNYLELPSLASYLYDEFGLDHACTPLSGNTRDSSLKLPPVDELDQVLSQVYTVRKPSLMQQELFAVYREILQKTYVENRQVIPCRAGSLICTIYANGDIHACPYLPSLGNLKKITFHEIWHGKDALKQFGKIKDGECSCADCCYIMPSLANYWKLPFLVLKKKLK